MTEGEPLTETPVFANIVLTAPRFRSAIAGRFYWSLNEK